MGGTLLIKNIPELVTCSGFEAKAGPAMADLGIILNGAVFIEDGIINAVGTTDQLCKEKNAFTGKTIDATGKAVLPGFVDPHTHLVFAGYRPEEFARRLKGDSYLNILGRGGGILSTVQATRKASSERLVHTALERLDVFLSQGVTTVEGKSGYGLDLTTEIKQLAVMKTLNERHPVDIVPTFLGAHAVPEKYRGKTDDYVAYVADTVLPTVAEGNLAEFCDVFCEKNVFSVAQSRQLLEKARAVGLKIKLHADEMSTLGGAELAASLKAVSADHLLRASDQGIQQMARAGVVAVLLPLTAFCLREPYARARHIIDQGCPVALATDLNPGSAFTSSIPLVIALATLYMDMSTEETVTALTLNAAAAVGRAKQIGSIDVGKKADLMLLSFPSYRFLPYYTGANSVQMVIKKGYIAYHNRGKGEEDAC